MTPTYEDHEDAVLAASRQLELPARGLTLLHNHATPVYLLPQAKAVARVATADQRASVQRAVDLSRWLVEHSVPATEPLDVPQPIDCGPYVIAFWVHYPQPDTPRPSTLQLGQILRQLHDLPHPPVELTNYRPLVSLEATVQQSAKLTARDRGWLLESVAMSTEAYDKLEFPLGEGFIHGDAYPGNTLWDGNRVVLGDWDEIAFGPREIDLANTFQGVRFGRTEGELSDFVHGYGYDPRSWSGLATLIKIRDLHTLGSYIKRADRGDEAAAQQLIFRIETLRTGDSSANWSPC
ncbi:phosphotransferase family protein [Streptomyces botrytidirepellens]|uniref:Aminoglycoside phosphotransferase family protein n=1 Tax=Streptomyces botrytidirepellens TaxID=2486417 RepID=A0A3M8X874_9ACTN|nr:aminoglycoside phosphotransferase family protein [Streptomyces botrytidirepellens]RNG37370.1 aminoglycoside phosphotransferase family protein [Streptomyces botrytidirepellens]